MSAAKGFHSPVDKKKSFCLLKDKRWVVRFGEGYYPICLPGPPYEGRPALVTRQELEEIEFYEPSENKSEKAKFIRRNALEVLVFFVPRNKKTGERLHSNGKWFFVNTNERIPLNQII